MMIDDRSMVNDRVYRFDINDGRHDTTMIDSRFTHRANSAGKCVLPWSMDRSAPRDCNRSIFGNDGKAVGNVLGRYLVAGGYRGEEEAEEKDEKKRKVKTMAQFREGLDLEDKVGLVHHKKPRNYGDTKCNKIQRMVDKLERDYMTPSKSCWRKIPTQPIPELLIKPALNDIKTQEGMVGLEKYKLDMRNPYSMEVLENILPVPHEVLGPYAKFEEVPKRTVHRTFGSSIEEAKIKREEYQRKRIEEIRKADIERMRLAKNCPPKYKKTIEQMETETHKIKKIESNRNTQMAKRFIIETPKPSRDKTQKRPHSSNPVRKTPFQDPSEGMTAGMAAIFREMRLQVDIPAFKQSDHLKRAIENASRKLVKARPVTGKVDAGPKLKKKEPSGQGQVLGVRGRLGEAPEGEVKEKVGVGEEGEVKEEEKVVRFNVRDSLEGPAWKGFYEKEETGVESSGVGKGMRASKGQPSKSTMAESRKVFREDDCESVVSDHESFSLVDGQPLEGQLGESFESEIEDVGSPDEDGETKIESKSTVAKKQVRFTEENTPGEQAAGKHKGNISWLNQPDNKSLTTSKIDKLYDQVYNNSRKINDMKLIDLLKMQKDKATNSKELQSKRKEAILRQCLQLESLIKSQASYEEIESYIGKD